MEDTAAVAVQTAVVSDCWSIHPYLYGYEDIEIQCLFVIGDGFLHGRHVNKLATSCRAKPEIKLKLRLTSGCLWSVL